MLGGNNMSRCCRHLHIKTPSKSTAHQSWALVDPAVRGRGPASAKRNYTIASVKCRILHSQEPRHLLSPYLTQWPASLKSSRTRIITPMSTSNKPPPTIIKATQPAKTVLPSSTPSIISDTKPDGKPPAPGLRTVYPERMVIYHAGTGKIVFLASLRLTTIFAFALFDLYAAPAFLLDGAPLWQTAALAICGIIPLGYVAYTATPYVTTIHMSLPPFARVSQAALQRFARGVPPATRLDLTTLSLIGKPRTSSTTAGDLRPTRKRLGMVNYERDTAGLNAARRWWRFRAVRDFNVQQGNDKKLKNGWVWRTVAETIEKRAATTAAAASQKVKAKQ